MKNYNRNLLQAALHSDQLGPLTKELPADVPLFTTPFNGSLASSLYHKSLNALGVKVYENNIRKIHNQYKPDYWYLNTVLMLPLTSLAERLGVKVIAHVHELHSSFESITYEQMAHAIPYAELVIGVTQQICELATIMGAKRTALHYPIVDLTNKRVSTQRAGELRKSLGIAPDTFVWAMVGTRIYRKSIDIFPFIAQALADQPCHFIWMGNSTPTGLNYLVDKQIESLGLSNVTFIDIQTDDYYNYLQLSDGLLLTSREEAFGKVIVEAATLGKPIVAPVAGGAREFILPTMGEFVDYPTPEEFRRAMLLVMNNLKAYDSTLLQERSQHFDVNAQIQAWEQTILSLPAH